MAILGLPVAIGCFILSDQFISLFYAGQYSASIIAFRIIALYIPIRLVSSISGTLLTSINRQKLRTVCVGLGAMFNIVLNAVMIPYLSYIGASIATVLSEVFLYIVFIYFKGVNLLLLVVLAGLVYNMMLILLKTFTQEDKDIFKQVVKRG